MGLLKKICSYRLKEPVKHSSTLINNPSHQLCLCERPLFACIDYSHVTSPVFWLFIYLLSIFLFSVSLQTQDNLSSGSVCAVIVIDLKVLEENCWGKLYIISDAHWKK